MFFIFAFLLFMASSLFSSQTNMLGLYESISPKSQRCLDRQWKITPAQLIKLRHVSSAEGEHNYVSKTGFFVSSGLFVLGLSAVYFSNYYYGLPFIGAAIVYALFKRHKASEALTQDQMRMQSILVDLKSQNKEMTDEEFTTLCWRMT